MAKGQGHAVGRDAQPELDEKALEAAAEKLHNQARQRFRTLLMTRGAPARTGRIDSAVIKIGAPKSHSKKPDGFLDLVEQVSPGPYVEVFARRARFGWDYWGDESLGTAELPGAVA